MAAPASELAVVAQAVNYCVLDEGESGNVGNDDDSGDNYAILIWLCCRFGFS